MNVFQFVWFLVLAAILPGFLATNVFGQDEPPVQRAPITSDRPSFTTDSNMMAPGEYQLEMGYTYTDFEHGHAGTFPETQFRYGWNEKWEIRIGWPGYAFDTEDGDIAGGTTFGFKHKLKDAGEHLLWDKLDNFSMAWISTFTLPTGHGPNDFDTQSMLGWNYELDARTSLAGNLGFGSPTDMETGDRFTQGIASIMCSRTVGDTTSVFGEFYTNFPAADSQDAEYVVQAGVLHRLSDDMQLDFRLGAGLNDQAPDWLLGFGLAYRF